MKKKLFVLITLFFFLNTYSQNLKEVTDSILLPEKFSKEIFFKLLDSAKIYDIQGNYTKSLKLNIANLKFALKNKDPHFIYLSYRNLGYYYMAVYDTIHAEMSLKKSRKNASLTKNDTVIGQTYMDFGVLYGTLKNNPEKASLYFDKAINIFKKNNDSLNLYKTNYNAANISLSHNNLDQAYSYIINAKKHETIKTSENQTTTTSILFGMYYKKIEKYDIAIKYFEEYIKILEKQSRNSDLEFAYDCYSKCLFKLGKLEEAYNTRLKYEDYLYNNLTEEASSKNAIISKKFQISEYQKEIKEIISENEYQAKILESKSKYNKILIVVSIILTILFIWLVTLSNKRKELVRLLKIKNKKYLKAKEETEKMAKVKTDFLSSISHELRTPLYGVIGLSTILSEDKSLKHHESDLKALKFSANHLLTLINDVIQLNKIDSKKIENNESFFSLKKLVNCIATTFKHKIASNRNTINIQFSKETPKIIFGNPKILSQILINLIGNACKFTKNGKIDVIIGSKNTSSKTVEIAFTIKDNGIGIAEEKHISIFNEFSQINNIRDNDYEGSGLGLPIVKKLLDSFNSKITLESKLGEGTTISFSLPYRTLETKNGLTEVTEKTDFKHLKDKSILVVDDNIINQTVTSKILKKYGVLCDLANNGAIAIEKTKHNSYDALLMDINMPIKNGIEAAYEIRKFNLHTPIIALTAVEVDEMKEKIFESGMNDLIIKPYDTDQFLKAVIKNIANTKHPINKLLKVI